MIKTFILILSISISLSCPDEPNCTHCAQTPEGPVCNQCYNGYVLKNKCIPVPKDYRIKDCAYYTYDQSINENLLCIQCDHGYALVSDNKCEPCLIDYCYYATAKENCQVCGHNKLFKLEDDHVVCLNKDNGIHKCFASSKGPDGTICHRCEDGFVLDLLAIDLNEICVKSNFIGCQALNKDPDEHNVRKCKFCLEGYYLITGGECIKNPESIDVSYF